MSKIKILTQNYKIQLSAKIRLTIFFAVKILNFDTKIRIVSFIKFLIKLIFLDRKSTFGTLCNVLSRTIEKRTTQYLY